MEELRDKLLKSIELNGRESKETVKISQQLDILIVKEMKKHGNHQKNNT